MQFEHRQWYCQWHIDFTEGPGTYTIDVGADTTSARNRHISLAAADFLGIRASCRWRSYVLPPVLRLFSSYLANRYFVGPAGAILCLIWSAWPGCAIRTALSTRVYSFKRRRSLWTSYPWMGHTRCNCSWVVQQCKHCPTFIPNLRRESISEPS